MDVVTISYPVNSQILKAKAPLELPAGLFNFIGFAEPRDLVALQPFYFNFFKNKHYRKSTNYKPMVQIRYKWH